MIPALLLLAYALAAPGDWPEPRQNSHLTAIQPLPGSMTKAPALLARYDLGRGEPSVTPVEIADGNHVGLALVSGALYCFAQDGTQLWKSHPPGVNFVNIVETGDFNSDGKKEIALRAGRSADPFGAALLVSLDDGSVLWRYDVEPMSYAWYLYVGDYLPDVASKQLVVIMHGYPPDKENGYIAFFDYAESSAAPAQRWRYDFDKYTCFPSFLQTDIDGDGVKELAVETHSRMWFFDVRSGEKKQFVEWDVAPANIRSYGLVEFVDLNGDKREDFLCIANFAQHHEVLLNKDGKFEKAWSHGWPESVTVGKMVTTWPRVPYGDIDGDGALEIVVSMYNADDENAWQVRAYDSVTGTLKYRYPYVVAAQMVDLDKDGVLEILANASGDPTIAERSGAHDVTRSQGAHMLKVVDGKLESIWDDDSAAATRREGPHLRRGDTFVTLVEHAPGIYGEAPWSKPALPPAPRFSKLPKIVGAPMPELLAADVTADGRNELILYNTPIARVLSLGEDGTFTSIKEYTSSCLPVIADLNGDGKAEVVTVEVSDSTRPKLTAHTLATDTVLWDVQLRKPERSGLPASRLAYLRTGRFTGKATPDLYLWAGTPMVRSLGIEGITGMVLWEKGEIPDSERYWGASVNFASTYDYDGDGNEDLVFTNPDYYCVAAGLTGNFLHGPAYPPEIFSQPSQGLYTYPAILEQPAGDPTICLVAGHYFQAAMSLRAQPQWYDLPLAGKNRCAMEGFIKAEDSSWVMGYGRQDATFACRNVSDGTIRWELPIKGSSSDVISCDVDGDGSTEFVFGTSHGELFAVRDAGDKGEVVWQTTLSAGASQPIAADIDGDGKSEIVIPTSDGYVNVYGTVR